MPDSHDDNSAPARRYDDLDEHELLRRLLVATEQIGRDVETLRFVIVVWAVVTVIAGLILHSAVSS